MIFTVVVFLLLKLAKAFCRWVNTTNGRYLKRSRQKINIKKNGPLPRFKFQTRTVVTSLTMIFSLTWYLNAFSKAVNILEGYTASRGRLTAKRLGCFSESTEEHTNVFFVLPVFSSFPCLSSFPCFPDACTSIGLFSKENR